MRQELFLFRSQGLLFCLFFGPILQLRFSLFTRIVMAVPALFVLGPQMGPSTAARSYGQGNGGSETFSKL